MQLDGAINLRKQIGSQDSKDDKPPTKTGSVTVGKEQASGVAAFSGSVGGLTWRVALAFVLGLGLVICHFSGLEEDPSDVVRCLHLRTAITKDGE